jgi:hypothetical protein
MEEGISRWEFWTGVVIALAPYIVSVYSRWRDSSDSSKRLEGEQKAKEGEQKVNEFDKVLEGWEELANGYLKQIENLRYLETEAASLRPLTLKVALLQQENLQFKEDKEDWKAYSQRLCDQLEQLGHVPLAFRRTPKDGDTGERMRRVSRRMKAVPEAQQEIKKNGDQQTILRNKEEEEK